MKTIRLICIIILFLGVVNFASAQESVKLHFINVGEGEAILIQVHHENVLIDTGNLLSGYKIIDYLARNKVKKIKYLIITHPHPDHTSGVFFLLPKIQVQEVYDNGQVLDENDDLQRWYGLLVRSRKNYRILKKGERLKLDDTNLDVLWPAKAEGGSFNENSLVIMFNDDNFKCLFTGDIGKITEEQLLKEKLSLKANILKVSHHGLMDATSKEFLEAVSPEGAIISTGPTRKTPSPSPSTLDLLKSCGIKIYRTDKDGNIEVIVHKKGKYIIKNN